MSLLFCRNAPKIAYNSFRFSLSKRRCEIAACVNRNFLYFHVVFWCSALYSSFVCSIMLWILVFVIVYQWSWLESGIQSSAFRILYYCFAKTINDTADLELMSHEGHKVDCHVGEVHYCFWEEYLQRACSSVSHYYCNDKFCTQWWKQRRSKVLWDGGSCSHS